MRPQTAEAATSVIRGGRFGTSRLQEARGQRAIATRFVKLWPGVW